MTGRHRHDRAAQGAGRAWEGPGRRALCCACRAGLRRGSRELAVVVALGLVLGLLLMLAACRDTSGRDGAGPTAAQAAGLARIVEIGARDAHRPVPLRAGQLLRVRLPESPATGEHWELGTATPELRLEADPGQIATGAVRVWTFRALRPGHAWLRFDPRPALDPPGQARAPVVVELQIH